MDDLNIKVLLEPKDIYEKALKIVCQEFGEKEEKSQAMIDAMPYWYIQLAQEELQKEKANE